MHMQVCGENKKKGFCSHVVGRMRLVIFMQKINQKKVKEE